MLLGYDASGRCPLLVDDRCSIYEDRPRTCRTYDCRVFVAAGVEPDKPRIAARVRSWERPFRYDEGSGAEEALAEVRRAAAEIDDGSPPTAVAVRAVLGWSRR